MANEDFRFKIGGCDCLVINDRDDWDCLALVVETGRQRVLIDTGCGYSATPPGRLMARLQAARLSAAEIDVVVFSHADCDHIGGAVDTAGQPAFPRARYLLSRTEWSFRQGRPARFRREANHFFDEAFLEWSLKTPVIRLAQLRDRLGFFEDGQEIAPGVRALAAPGHTPGMTALAITSGQDQLLFVADMLYGRDLGPGPAGGVRAIGDPAWHAFIDVDPAQALATRDRFFEQAASQHTLLMSAHAPGHGLGYVLRLGAGWGWQARNGAA